MSCLIVTFEEMLRLALGTTPLTQVQVAVLHSFLKILIQKLNIQTDFVEISGPEANKLRELLLKAQKPKVDFIPCRDERLTTEINIFKMDTEIKRLSLTINDLEANLNKHLEAIERCKLPPAAKLKLKNPKTKKLEIDEEEYSSDDEDLCVPCDEKHLIACDLLQNEAFLKKLMRRVTSPVVDRIFEFENSISVLNEKFQNFLNTAEDEYKKVPLIEEAFKQIEELRKQLTEHLAEFIETMEEIQEMMDTKLDKIHIPALKRYMTDRLVEIDKKVTYLLQKDQCPKAAGVIVTNLQCLCCTSKVCQNKTVNSVPLLADISPYDRKPITTFDPKFCIPPDQPRAAGGFHTIIWPEEKRLLKSNLLDEFGDQIKLPHDPVKKVEFFRGKKGCMYRKCPQTDCLK